MTLVFKKHNGPTPVDDIAPQIITDCGNLTLDFKQLGLWASPPFLQTLGPWKEDFGPLGNSPVLLLLSPGKTPLMTTVIFDQYLYFHLSNGVVYFIRFWFPVSTFCNLTHIYCIVVSFISIKVFHLILLFYFSFISINNVLIILVNDNNPATHSNS